MPELPEVEVVKRGLEPHLPGRVINALRYSGKKLRTEVPLQDMLSLLVNREITGLRRRAKYLIVEMDSGTLLIIHLGMTGKLGLFAENSLELPHDHVTWVLDNGLELRFNDVRRFGSISLVRHDQTGELENTFFKTTGPEPFGASFSAAYLKKKAAGKSQPVKNFIMNNQVVAGLGNIYANESLYAAGIRPTRPAGKISNKKWTILVEEIRNVLSWAISCGGSTISDFLDASGKQGYFQVNFRVYGRTEEACSQCGSPIKMIKLGGRASFFCPRCQR